MDIQQVLDFYANKVKSGEVKVVVINDIDTLLSSSNPITGFACSVIGILLTHLYESEPVNRMVLVETIDGKVPFESEHDVMDINSMRSDFVGQFETRFREALKATADAQKPVTFVLGCRNTQNLPPEVRRRCYVSGRIDGILSV